MTARPRCARGHFLPAAGNCRCFLPRPRPRADLWGQGLTRRRLRTMTTVQLTGSYL
ncbi:hypothetical protein ACIOC2_20235 [Streptomyces sp. NPDC088337]|uniref:hypothetical protein n=1 Tax=unclassified Streptomyces TaxID=2593676 RepID=UPI00381C64A4